MERGARWAPKRAGSDPEREWCAERRRWRHRGPSRQADRSGDPRLQPRRWCRRRRDTEADDIGALDPRTRHERQLCVGAAVAASGRQACRRLVTCRRSCVGGRSGGQVGRRMVPVVRSGCRRGRLPRRVMRGHGRGHILETQRKAGRQHRRGSGQGKRRRDDRQRLGPTRHDPSIPPGHPRSHKSCRLSRRALAMTETELKVIAALAMIGLSSRPKTG